MRRIAEPLRFLLPLREVRLSGPGAPPLRSEQNAREEAAFERGRREAEKALSEQLLRQRSELLDLQQGVLRSLRDLMPQIVHECEGSLIALALEAAQKLVGGLPVSSEMIEAVVNEALVSIEGTSEFTIYLHAEDLELLQRVNSPLLLNEVAGERIRFQAGREVTKGGCVIQTHFGSVDARRETKLAMLKSSMKE